MSLCVSWGWSHGKNECGAYLNTNCDADSSEAADDEEDDEDDMEFTTQDQQRQEVRHHMQLACLLPAPLDGLCAATVGPWRVFSSRVL